MRTLLLCLLVACAKPAAHPTTVTGPDGAPVAPGAAPATSSTTVPVGPGWRDGPGGFPLPKDAESGTLPIGDEVTYEIRRARDEVHAQLLAKLAADGYVVDKEQLVMDGYRMAIHRADGQRFFVSVTENDDSTLMTITAK